LNSVTAKNPSKEEKQHVEKSSMRCRNSRKKADKARKTKWKRPG